MKAKIASALPLIWLILGFLIYKDILSFDFSNYILFSIIVVPVIVLTSVILGCVVLARKESGRVLIAIAFILDLIFLFYFIGLVTHPITF